MRPDNYSLRRYTLYIGSVFRWWIYYYCRHIAPLSVCLYVCVYFERNNDNMQDLLKQILIRWGNVTAACLYCINSAHDYLAIEEIRVRFEMNCSHLHSQKYIFRVTYIECSSAFGWKNGEKTKYILTLSSIQYCS